MKKLYIVSTGAGGTNYLTREALDAINDSEVIVGYTKYIKELKIEFGDKELLNSGMTKEIARCDQAIEIAKTGKTTTIVSNGDVNVFGMATLVVELMDEKDLWDEIEIVSVPGVSSVFAAACKVGAPISQDFAVISLSDRLTDPNMINKRIFNALDADFVVAIYNPKSKKRVQPYLDFLEILNKFDERIVTVAQNVGREEKEHIAITTSTDLIEQGLEHEDVGMSTLIIVGNSNSRLTKNGQILTPRGYLKKYETTGDLK